MQEIYEVTVKIMFLFKCPHMMFNVKNLEWCLSYEHVDQSHCNSCQEIACRLEQKH